MRMKEELNHVRGPLFYKFLLCPPLAESMCASISSFLCYSPHSIDFYFFPTSQPASVFFPSVLRVITLLLIWLSRRNHVLEAATREGASAVVRVDQTTYNNARKMCVSDYPF